MKKSILKINGVQEMNKIQQLNIKGGADRTECCKWDSNNVCICRRSLNILHGGGYGPCNIPVGGQICG